MLVLIEKDLEYVAGLESIFFSLGFGTVGIM
jgi:hypothetical protein